MKNLVVLEYVHMPGQGAFFKGVPANHLTTEQLAELAARGITKEFLLESDLYQPYKGPAIVPEALTQARALAVPFDMIKPTGEGGVIMPRDVRLGLNRMRTEAAMGPPADDLAGNMTAGAQDLIKTAGVDPAKITGTGTDGKITKPDVEAYVAKLSEESED